MKQTGSLSNLSDFDYDLPLELIAQEPAPRREGSRLLVVDRAAAVVEDSRFVCLPDHLRPGDLLIANESRVVPARVRGSLKTGGAVQFLLVKQLSESTWEVIARPAVKLRAGVEVELSGGVRATVQGMAGEGRRIVRFTAPSDIRSWLRDNGELPLPPYIKRYAGDPERYQTVYARQEGSIAAPTAGLHFSESLLRSVRERGVDLRFITLHVGPATFKPVHEENLSSIHLEPESGTIDAATAAAIVSAKEERRRVIAVGTTTTRLLEGLWRRQGRITAWSGEIDLFIRPPFSFQVVDALITNFHLPRSTLLMLASAFAGPELIRRAYDHAIARRYRFYSFGDAMFVR